MFGLKKINKLNKIIFNKKINRNLSTTTEYKHVDNMSLDEIFKREPFDKSNYIIYPREKPGLNYKLNWSLCRANIVPWDKAWRNLKVDELTKKCNCQVNENGVVNCNNSYSKPEEVELDNKSDFEDLSDLVKKYLSGVPDLFVEDCGLGSHRHGEIKLRTVTNDPVSALCMRNMGV